MNFKKKREREKEHRTTRVCFTLLAIIRIDRRAMMRKREANPSTADALSALLARSPAPRVYPTLFRDRSRGARVVRRTITSKNGLELQKLMDPSCTEPEGARQFEPRGAGYRSSPPPVGLPPIFALSPLSSYIRGYSPPPSPLPSFSLTVPSRRTSSPRSPSSYNVLLADKRARTCGTHTRVRIRTYAHTYTWRGENRGQKSNSRCDYAKARECMHARTAEMSFPPYARVPVRIDGERRVPLMTVHARAYVRTHMCVNRGHAVRPDDRPVQYFTAHCALFVTR